MMSELKMPLVIYLMNQHISSFMKEHFAFIFLADYVFSSFMNSIARGEIEAAAKLLFKLYISACHLAASPPPFPEKWNKFEFMIWILFRRKMFSRKSRKVEASLSTEA